MVAAKKGLYANIDAKRKRIASGSGEKMRKAGDEGAPTSDAFAKSARTSRTATRAGGSTAGKTLAKKVGGRNAAATKKSP